MQECITSLFMPIIISDWPIFRIPYAIWIQFQQPYGFLRLGVGVQVHVPCCRTDDFGPDDPTEAFKASFSEALETLEKKERLGVGRVEGAAADTENANRWWMLRIQPTEMAMSYWWNGGWGMVFVLLAKQIVRVARIKQIKDLSKKISHLYDAFLLHVASTSKQFVGSRFFNGTAWMIFVPLKW